MDVEGADMASCALLVNFSRGEGGRKAFETAISFEFYADIKSFPIGLVHKPSHKAKNHYPSFYCHIWQGWHWCTRFCLPRQTKAYTFYTWSTIKGIGKKDWITIQYNHYQLLSRWKRQYILSCRWWIISRTFTNNRIHFTWFLSRLLSEEKV